MHATKLSIGAAIPLAMAAGMYLWLRTPHVRPNILLVTVDTLRADHLGTYGYARKTSPAIDALARRGVLFEQAFTQAALSGPSHATLMTSLPTPRHGAINNTVELRGENLTLAEVLRLAGYETAMFVGEHFVGEKFGFSQGFDTAETHLLGSHRHQHAEDDEALELTPPDAVFTRALDWLRKPRTRPFFLWVHAQHPHASYEPPPPYDTMFGAQQTSGPHDPRCMDTLGLHQKGEITLDDQAKESAIALYDGEIAYVDSQVARILRELDASGQSGGTIVMLTADHGEMLFDDPAGREIGHGRQRFDVVLRVPLILAGFGQAGRRVGTPVGLIDVAPTLLELGGIARPQVFEGQSLVSLMEGGSTKVRETSFSCTFHTDGVIRLSSRDELWKAICDRRDSVMHCQVYDLSLDPREQRDLAGVPEHAERVASLQASLDAWFEQTTARAGLLETKPTDKQALKLLRRAGYLEEER